MSRATFAVDAASLVSEPRNVVRVSVTDHSRGLDVDPTIVLLSAREARELARMLVEVADAVDDLTPVVVQ